MKFLFISALLLVLVSCSHHSSCKKEIPVGDPSEPVYNDSNSYTPNLR